MCISWFFLWHYYINQTLMHIVCLQLPDDMVKKKKKKKKKNYQMMESKHSRMCKSGMCRVLKIRLGN